MKTNMLRNLSQLDNKPNLRRRLLDEVEMLYRTNSTRNLARAFYTTVDCMKEIIAFVKVREQEFEDLINDADFNPETGEIEPKGNKK